MEATVVQPEKVQADTVQKKEGNKAFRWSKWVDGDGCLWIVTLTYGFYPSGIYGSMVELLNVDSEATIDIKRDEFDMWVRTGTIKRVDLPIMV